jgi:phage gp36-like protein
MAYATPAELYLYALPSAAIPDMTADEVQAQLDAASALVDSYIGSRFDLPLSGTIPIDIVSVTCDLAAYALMKHRGFNPESGDAEQFETARKNAVSWLKDVQSGKATPTGVKDSSTPTVTHQDAPFVVAAGAGSAGVVATFYEPPSNSTDVAPLGTPTRRGW